MRTRFNDLTFLQYEDDIRMHYRRQSVRNQDRYPVAASGKFSDRIGDLLLCQGIKCRSCFIENQ